MKKYIFIFVAALTVLFQSCEKYEPGGTAVKDMAGDWWVTYEAETSPGVWEDVMGGHYILTTYNTAANKSTEMWVNDHGEFWNFKSVVSVDYGAKTFLTNDSVSTNSAKYPTEKVLFKGGKVLKNAAKTPSGTAADSIVFFVEFNDDPDAIVYKVAGFRKTGFYEDDFQ
jgi:hypothetical protein